MEDETMFNLYRVFWMLKDVFIEFIGFAVVAMRIALAFVSNEPDSAHIQTRIRESLVAFKSTLGSRDSEMREALSTESGDGFQGRKSSTNSPNTYNIEKRVSFIQAAIFAGENKTLPLVTSTLNLSTQDDRFGSDLQRVMASSRKYRRYKPGVLSGAILFIPATVSSSIANLIFVGLFSMQCMIVCIMDGVMAWTFVQHIRDMGKDIRLVSPKLSIIANYGLMACMFAFSTVGCVAASFVCRFVDPELQSDETYNAYHILWILKDIFIEMMGIAIVVMRISLAFVETNDTTHILDRIQQSFAACESITSKKGSKTQHTSIITTKIDRNRVNNLSVPYEQ
ncbi:hypothetical protein BCR33DRAFT_743972 [Rhizoclosmatium globosum]|uniref:Uncharacterized protein n=1 Tax=Rhizoclosmatium globosum TaxID=329046 RepID=A0A1Y2BFY7_9FUNG|nr:hypothetical protein BCR33DRAFT_743972 [Rhizoclosmatium globosum]|eukprot:ORY32995.1 hypothetical protein BCR33DRAFT_743972 [Rhizoclosmatium globosum]